MEEVSIRFDLVVAPKRVLDGHIAGVVEIWDSHLHAAVGHPAK